MEVEKGIVMMDERLRPAVNLSAPQKSAGGRYK
jgi:hypothetical protein